MAIATISEDGKVEIPETMREQLGITAGDKVALSLNEKGELLVRKAKTWRDFEGIFHRPGQRPVSVEEMNEAIGDAIVEKYERKERS
jgi:AbrB family looped-hinge helix DNA binding protein